MGHIVDHQFGQQVHSIQYDVEIFEHEVGFELITQPILLESLLRQHLLEQYELRYVFDDQHLLHEEQTLNDFTHLSHDEIV